MSTAHPAALDAAYGVIAAEPVARLRFTLAGADPVNVVPLAGSRLSWDASRWPRADLTATLPTTITPSLLPAAISAYGGRLEVTLGARWRGQDYVFRAGTLAVTKVDVDRPDARVTVEAASLEAVVNEDRYDTRTPTPAGTVSAVVAGIVHRTLPGVVVVNRLGALDVALAAGRYELDGDVWPVIEQVMDTAGGAAWFDAAGQLVLEPAPVVGVPVLTIATGEAGGLTGYSSSRAWAPNRVALVYEDQADPPARRVGVWEDHRGGPTDVAGPYGRHTYRQDYSSLLALPSQADANAGALAMARRVVGRFRTVTARAIPAPWLLPGDTVRVGMLGGLVEDHVVQSLELPLPGLDVMTLTTRSADYTGGPF